MAVVGMPGAGKSEAVNILKQRGFAVIRFGDETDRGLVQQGLPLSAESEKVYREKLRAELGMSAYAQKALPKIEEVQKNSNMIVLDGLYSWEEYLYLKEHFETLQVVGVFANSKTRYERLAKRQIRPLTSAEARKRDIDEIEKLNKGGPIAAADYIIENNGTKEELEKKIDALLQELSLA